MIYRPRRKYDIERLDTVTPVETYDSVGNVSLSFQPVEHKSLGTIDFYTIESMRDNGMELGTIHVGSLSRFDASKQEDAFIAAIDALPNEESNKE